MKSRLKQDKKVITLGIVAIVLLMAVVYKVHSVNSLKSEGGSGADQDQQIMDSQKQFEDNLSKQGKAQAINGELVDANKVQRPFAVVVENFYPDARPQSGLSQADIVYEALAEGGITRYMAVFQTQDVKMIGPVRSARTYFNDWAQELRAIFAHVGGNSDALYYLKQGIPGVSNADQFFNGDYFERRSDIGRVPPHNTYTSTAQLQALAKARNFSMQPTYPDYLFKDDAPAGANADATNIAIDFSMPEYAVKWVYDPASNTYKRYLAGKADVDAGNKQQIVAKDVIVQRVANWPVATDTPLSISMGTRAGGGADVFQDGQDIKATWKLVDGRTEFFDQSGKQIALDRGQIWIEIVPPANTVTASK